MAELSALLAKAHLKRARPFTTAEFMPFQPKREAPAPDVAQALKAALDQYNQRRQEAHG